MGDQDGGDGTAPHVDAETLVSFLNTLDQRTFTRHGHQFEPGDALGSAAALGDWLVAEGLVARPRATATDLADALALRAALRDSLAGAGGAVEVGYPLRLVTDGSGALRLVCTPPRPGAVGQALANLVAAAASATVRGGWNRVRLCAAEECRWAFVDASRRGDKRWCSSDTCGNRHKTADYRARARQRED